MTSLIAEIERFTQNLPRKEDLTEEARVALRSLLAELEGLTAANPAAMLRALLQNLYDTSVKVWHDNSDETPGHVSDPWVWTEWIDAIETTGDFLKASPEPIHADRDCTLVLESYGAGMAYFRP